ncbi:LemA family protein [Undibacterium oligocarboniphilum]|uniref:LemA family protein n=1 Tax=Undibacterium oligocarboniphilum TaxID=666702 RepID=A0A850QJ65_9BURK|nr:LemA family protein [Undibacterium oligocarboniphilum]MBC3870923.1 LemA family protein [Undibacterium oligocarboniphilum]NVO76454.1 LemA family protein [Undibacterium oligocarboniphilum]
MIAMIILLVVIALIVFWVIGVYNRLVSLRNRFRNGFSQIDVQLKRRYDLIPNLVEVAKGYMKHERETLEAVIAARNQAVTASSNAGNAQADAASVQQLAAAEGTLNASLGRLFALSEAYPDLKANQNMIQLTEELTATENKIAFARQAYNDSVMQYNTGIEQFPGSLIANTFGFKAGELLQATESAEERKAVKVSF